MNQRNKPREEDIATRAYKYFVQRGGVHGKDVEDWVTAERELTEEAVAGVAATSALPKASRRQRVIVS